MCETALLKNLCIVSVSIQACIGLLNVCPRTLEVKLGFNILNQLDTAGKGLSSGSTEGC